MMPQSFSKVIIHIVFSTKNRVPYLQNADLRNELYAYMATVLRDQVDSQAILINGVEDHVHILLTLSRKHAIMAVVKTAKTETTKWLKQARPELHDFAWQTGYGVFSVSESNVEQVRNYIAKQEEHHRKMTFQDELRGLCQRHGLELDERYAWD